MYVGIANESGGITLIPLQVSVSGQGAATLHTLPAQTLTGTLAVQSAVTIAAAKPVNPLRKGSLPLFFRKVRLLCGVYAELSCEAEASSSVRPRSSTTWPACASETCAPNWTFLQS